MNDPSDGATAEPGVMIPTSRPGRSQRSFWVAMIGWGFLSGLLVLLVVAEFTAATSGAADWSRGLEHSLVAAPAVGLVSGFSAQRRARSSWRGIPWTAVQVDADGLAVTGHGRPSGNTYSIAWDLVEQVGITDNGVGSWVVVRFVVGTFSTSAQARAWADQHGAQQRYPDDPSTFNLCRPAMGAGAAEAGRIVSRVRETIREQGGPRFVDLDRLGRPRQRLS